MATLRRSPQAEIDLETILEELQKNNPSAAERYATAFYEKGRMLAQFPELGRLRPEIAPDLRSTLVHPYVLFYRIAGEEIHVLRILHGRRDLRRIMQEESDQ
jgi:toxin ParE1/3/4